MGAHNFNDTSSYWLCPLYSFDCDSDRLELTEGMTISELELLPHHFRIYLTEIRESLIAGPEVANWAILLPHSKKLGPIDLDHITDFVRESEATMYLEDLVTALRLCHKGTVAAGEVVFALPSHVSIQFPIYMSDNEDSWTWREGPKYKLSQSDVPKVNKLIKETHKWRKKVGAVDIAIRRFNLAYSGDYESKIIDQMIAFESLYIADDKELGYKLALRTAFLLGKRRKQIFSDIKKAYDLRSKVVHGTQKVDRSKLQETIPKTEEYLRQSMRRFLELLSQGHSLREIRDKLDENILKNGKTLAQRE